MDLSTRHHCAEILPDVQRVERLAFIIVKVKLGTVVLVSVPSVAHNPSDMDTLINCVRYLYPVHCLEIYAMLCLFRKGNSVR